MGFRNVTARQIRFTTILSSELGITQGDIGDSNFRIRRFAEVRMKLPNPLKSRRVLGLVALKEVFGLILKMLQVRVGRQVLEWHNKLPCSKLRCLTSAKTGRKLVSNCANHEGDFCLSRGPDAPHAPSKSLLQEALSLNKRQCIILNLGSSEPEFSPHQARFNNARN